MEEGAAYVYADIKCCPMCCVGIYRDGLQLQCGHAMCSSCAHMIGSRGEWACPVCGEVSPAVEAFIDTRPKAVADTNVFEVKLSKLAEPSPIATGDPVFCRICAAALNCYSTVTTEESQQVWKCEFCSHVNPLSLDPAEIPKSDHITYILDPAAAAGSAETDGDCTTCIFCIDTSGSMGTAVHVNTPISIKGQQPTSRPTRLNCVVAAIEAQVNQMLERSPNRHIGIVEFESAVTVHGDGTSSENVGVDVNSFDALFASMAGKHDLLLSKSLAQAKDGLLTKVLSLYPKNMTALGPGLTVSVALASEGRPGSKVIICTDGIANVGVGSIERGADAQAFYDQVGLIAQRNGVTVSIISVTDGECKLAYLSSVANMTEGTILKVNPETMADDFSNILQERTIATEARVRVTMHKGLKFKNEDPSDLQLLGSQLTRVVGNVGQYSSFTFEYAIKTSEEMQTSEVDLAGVTQLPFQLIIEYRNLAGQRCIKTFAKVLKLTTDKKEVERNVRNEVLYRNYGCQQARRADYGYYGAVESMDADYVEMLGRVAATEEEKAQMAQVVGAVGAVRGECRTQLRTEAQAGMQIDESALSREELRRQRVVMRTDCTTVTTAQLKSAQYPPRS